MTAARRLAGTTSCVIATADVARLIWEISNVLDTAHDELVEALPPDDAAVVWDWVSDVLSNTRGRIADAVVEHAQEDATDDLALVYEVRAGIERLVELVEDPRVRQCSTGDRIAILISYGSGLVAVWPDRKGVPFEDPF
jgi:hypothetical protein